MGGEFKIAKPHIGTTEYKEKSDSLPVDLLPSNKIVYLTKLNSEDDKEPELTRCKNLKEVFANYKPSREVTINKQDGSEETVDLKFKSMKDFGSLEIIKQNEYLENKYNEVEMLRNLKNLLDKPNSKLKKQLSSPEKKAEFMAAIKSYIEKL
ncbi:MAG: type VI secretion system contractile sheath small subunit [candidate division Zixibacteria bacterium]|nr:type VI secretion system contractile sheath small subunit [candidate division Zixibacteria bacterium]